MQFKITEEELHDLLRTVFGGSIVEVKTEYRILREGFLKRE